MSRPFPSGLAALLLATVGLAALPACSVDLGDDDTAGDDDDSSGPTDAYAFCVDETNRYRATVGRPAVARSTALEDYANEGAEVDFHGEPHQHFGATGGGGISFAENECPHWSLSGFGNNDMKMLVASCIAAFWEEGPGGGHYDNMVSDNKKLGCGIFQDGDDVTIIQDYGP
jgi:hypothetical protein